MLVSHSNQMGITKSSVVPICPSQFNREIYDMGSTQYNNMNFSANLNAPADKTAVPMSVDKRCPTQDSLRYPGGNGEGILHSRSTPASDEAKDQQMIDARKQRRMLSNRESARRSRLRKQQHMDELSAQLARLKAENGQIQNKFNIATQQYAQITNENCLMRLEASELSHKLQRLQQIINAQSHSAFKAMNIETGSCCAAQLSYESGTIDYTFMPSDLLF